MSKIWNKPWNCAGVVAPGAKINFEFEYLGNEPIKEGVHEVKISDAVTFSVTNGVKGTCGCTNVERKGNKVVGTLAVDKDYSSVSKRYVPVQKSISIYYEDGSTSTLYLHAIVDKILDEQKDA